MVVCDSEIKEEVAIVIIEPSSISFWAVAYYGTAAVAHQPKISKNYSPARVPWLVGISNRVFWVIR